MPKSAARAETPGSRNSGLASVASPQGPQAGRGGCLAAGSILLLSLELAAPLAHPLSQRLPHTHPSGRTPHPEQPSVATNDSLDSQGWLALREGLGQGGMHHQPPPAGAGGQRGQERLWPACRTRPTAASHTGLAGLSQGDMATSHSLQIGSGGEGFCRQSSSRLPAPPVKSRSAEPSPHPASGPHFFSPITMD